MTLIWRTRRVDRARRFVLPVRAVFVANRLMVYRDGQLVVKSGESESLDPIRALRAETFHSGPRQPLPIARRRFVIWRRRLLAAERARVGAYGRYWLKHEGWGLSGVDVVGARFLAPYELLRYAPDHRGLRTPSIRSFTATLLIGSWRPITQPAPSRHA